MGKEPLTISEYQDFVERCMLDRSKRLNRPSEAVDYLLELCGEIGELINAHKHLVRWGPADTSDKDFGQEDAVISELGDVFWYLTAVCNILKIDITEVMQTNIYKLTERYGEMNE